MVENRIFDMYVLLLSLMRLYGSTASTTCNITQIMRILQVTNQFGLNLVGASEIPNSRNHLKWYFKCNFASLEMKVNYIHPIKFILFKDDILIFRDMLYLKKYTSRANFRLTCTLYSFKCL